MAFNAAKAAADIVPTFKFQRVGDGFRMEITDVQDEIDIDDKDPQGGAIRGTGRFISVKGKILACVGGNVDENDNVTDVPEGEERSVLLQYEYRPADSPSFKGKPSIMTKAVANALVKAGADGLAVGGELRLKHHELGPRNKENPSWNRPKYYEATYTKPVKTVSVGAAVDQESPF